MKPDFINFKITLSTGTLSTGDTTVTKFVTAPRGEHAKKLNESFIQAVRELEDFLENPPKTEKETDIDKPIKEKKIKNAKDNS